MRRFLIVGLLVGCHRDLDVSPCSHDPASCEEAGVDSGANDTASLASDSSADTESDSTIEDSGTADTAIAESSADGAIDSMIMDTAAADTAVADTAIADTCTCVPGETVAGTGACAAVLEKKTKTCAASCTWGPEVCALPKGWTGISLPPTGFQGRNQEAFTWTGGELIVHGGTRSSEGLGSPFGDGAIYQLTTNSWSLLPATAAPAGRASHSAVWDGSRDVLFWGGRNGATSYNDGFIYDSFTKSWSASAIATAPLAARFGHGSVWATTTKEMIVWGGNGTGGPFKDGASYNPSTKAWTMLPVAPISARIPVVARWTGAEMLVWGGRDDSGPLWDGALYDPVKKTWRAIASSTISPRQATTAASSGDRLALYGGIDGTTLKTDGEVFSLSAATWSAIVAPSATTLEPRLFATSFLIGDRIYQWSGNQDAGGGEVTFPRSGASYDFLGKVWTAMSASDPPAGRFLATVVTTPSFALIWSGLGKPGGGAIDVLRDGAIYVP